MHYADYMMILSPPPEVDKEIQRYKKASVNLVGRFDSMNSRAHISIWGGERQKTFLVEPAISLMERKLIELPPAEFKITGFDFFNPHDKSLTIYAAVQDEKQWIRRLQQHIPIKTQITPHITVARNLPKSHFNMLWPNFARVKFEMTFCVQALTILKRDTFAQDKSWKTYKNLWFNKRELQH